MKLLTKKDKRTNLDKAIDSILKSLESMDPQSEDYTKCSENLSKLYEAKALTAKDKVSKDTLVAVGGNLLGLALILNFERMGIITTKALGFVIRSRV